MNTARQLIDAAALTQTPPTVTPAMLEEFIASTHFINAGDAITENVPESVGCLTLCVVVLKNGFTVTGESACADPAKYNREIGESIARANAVNKIWPLLGFTLRDVLVERELGL